MTEAVDHARFGRQIALPEIGAEGQARLGGAQVVFPQDAAGAAAREVFARVGGGGVDPPTHAIPGDGPTARILGAWQALEQARAILGAPPVEMPPALLGWLTP